MKRIDEFYTHEKDGVQYRIGRMLPFGANLIGNDVVNFSIFSRDATYCELLLYHLGEEKPYVVLPFPENFKIGSVFSMMVIGIDWENTEYGYRFDGPHDRAKGYRFDLEKVLLDPYAKLVSGRDVWHQRTYGNNPFHLRGRIIREDYEWEGDTPVGIPIQDYVIYEMHVRGFTKDKSSGVKHGGTYAGVVEKIPYLKELGINCIEFMPVFEFEEFIPELDDRYVNYWGYVTTNYFSPKAGYAFTGAMGLAADEFKNMVKQLHKAGIAIVLDIVYNHTAEGNDNGITSSFRGIDNRTYYVLNEDGTYADYTGCKNTLNCNNPIVRTFILDSLRYWVTNYHVDGFRVDEAPIFARGQDGKPMISPPLVESLVNDPILSNTVFISEGWDFGGLSTVGHFPKGWADWNPRMRDTVKRFVKSMPENGPDLLRAIEGSPDMFPNGSPDVSINYITSHDGFTLYDSVCYQKPRCETNAFPAMVDWFDNCTWNCGFEGETDDPEINALRIRQMKNMTVLLFLSRGIPMFWAGDEFANTQFGNNNAYSQDCEVSWIDWSRLEKFHDLFEFNKLLISFRKKHPVMRRTKYFTGYNSSGYPELSWHGEKPWMLDKDNPFYTFAFMYSEPAKDFGTQKDCFIYCGVNAHWESHMLELPIIPEGMKWRVFTYTGDPENKLPDTVIEGNFHLMPRSLVVLIGEK